MTQSITKHVSLHIDCGGFNTSLYSRSDSGKITKHKTFCKGSDFLRFKHALIYLKSLDLNWDALFVGLRGYSNKSKIEKFQSFIYSFFPNKVLKIMPDYEEIWQRTFSKTESGLVLSSGTGAFCYGRKSGIRAHAGGFGLNFYDPGGSIYLGYKVLFHLLQKLDSPDEVPDILEKEILNRFNVKKSREWSLHFRDEGSKTRTLAQIGDIYLIYCKECHYSGKILNENISFLIRFLRNVAMMLDIKHNDRFSLMLHGGLIERHPFYAKKITDSIEKIFPKSSIF